jgi:hypothetical protein
LLSITSASADDAVASFQVPSPGAPGTYQIQLVAGQVADPSGNRAAGQGLGSFAAVPSASSPTPAPSGESATIQSGLPAAATAGEAGTLVLDLTNNSAARTNGPVTVSLFASAGTALDASGVTLGPPTHRRLSLAAGAGKVLRLKYTIPSTLPTGDYYVLTEVSPGNGSTPGSVTASAAPVHVAAKVIDLAGQFAPHAALTLAAGRGGVVGIVVTNDGNSVAKGPVEISFTAAPAGGGAAVPLSTATGRINLKAGASRTLRLRFKVPAGTPAGTYTLQAVVDPNHIFADPNPANNSATDQPPFTVS